MFNLLFLGSERPPNAFFKVNMHFLNSDSGDYNGFFRKSSVVFEIQNGGSNLLCPFRDLWAKCTFFLRFFKGQCHFKNSCQKSYINSSFSLNVAFFKYAGTSNQGTNYCLLFQTNDDQLKFYQGGSWYKSYPTKLSHHNKIKMLCQLNRNSDLSFS